MQNEPESLSISALVQKLLRALRLVTLYYWGYGPLKHWFGLSWLPWIFRWHLYLLLAALTFVLFLAITREISRLSPHRVSADQTSELLFHVVIAGMLSVDWPLSVLLFMLLVQIMKRLPHIIERWGPEE